MSYFVGLRATGDLAANERPQHWRAGVMKLFPNGSAPLTALTTLMKSEKVTDYYYHWWDELLTTQRAAVVAGQCYDEASLTTAYVLGAAAAAGTNHFFKIATEADTKMFRIGHVILMRDASDHTVDLVGKCILVQPNGVNSVIGVQLLEADDNSTLNHDLSTVDTLLVIGNANPQGGTRPTAIGQAPEENYNYTQIFRDPLDLARTLMHTKLRTEQAYPRAKRTALEQHSIGMEKAFMWGIRYSTIGSNGKPETYTGGLLQTIKAAGTVQDYSLDPAAAYSGKTWVTAGVDWIDEHLEEIFRYGSTERLAFCGSGALLGIQRLVRTLGVYQINARTTDFGLQVREWVTPFGQVTLVTHPLFSYEATNRNSMVIIEPANIIYNYIDDTFFKPDKSDTEGGGTGKDGKEEEYLTECGLEHHNAITCGYLTGVGLDNPGA